MKVVFDFVGNQEEVINNAALTLVDLFNRGGFVQALEMHCRFKKLYIETVKVQPRKKDSNDIEIKIEII